VYGDGLHTRDWLYVEDHCRAVERVLVAGSAGKTYNIGGRNEWTNIEIVRLLCRLMDKAFGRDPELSRRFRSSPGASGRASETLITFVKDRPGHDRRYATDAGKIERELGFRAVESLETGLQKTLDWYLDHEDWWRGIMDGGYREWMRQQYGNIVSF
jgi:dTDP-glucose 4,6-dehydratase